jgi:hypothetical protein
MDDHDRPEIRALPLNPDALAYCPLLIPRTDGSIEPTGIEDVVSAHGLIAGRFAGGVGVNPLLTMSGLLLVPHLTSEVQACHKR